MNIGGHLCFHGFRRLVFQTGLEYTWFQPTLFQDVPGRVKMRGLPFVQICFKHFRSNCMIIGMGVDIIYIQLHHSEHFLDSNLLWWLDQDWKLGLTQECLHIIGIFPECGEECRDGGLISIRLQPRNVRTHILGLPLFSSHIAEWENLGCSINRLWYRYHKTTILIGWRVRWMTHCILGWGGLVRVMEWRVTVSLFFAHIIRRCPLMFY